MARAVRVMLAVLEEFGSIAYSADFFESSRTVSTMGRSVFVATFSKRSDHSSVVNRWDMGVGIAPCVGALELGGISIGG